MLLYLQVYAPLEQMLVTMHRHQLSAPGMQSLPFKMPSLHEMVGHHPLLMDDKHAQDELARAALEAPRLHADPQGSVPNGDIDSQGNAHCKPTPGWSHVQDIVDCEVTYHKSSNDLEICKLVCLI